MISPSLMQKRPEGEMSTVPSSPIGVCSLPSPRTDSPSGLQMALTLVSVLSLVKFGSATCTLARMPVPRFVGQLVMTPKSGE